MLIIRITSHKNCTVFIIFVTKCLRVVLLMKETRSAPYVAGFAEFKKSFASLTEVC